VACIRSIVHIQQLGPLNLSSHAAATEANGNGDIHPCIVNAKFFSRLSLSQALCPMPRVPGISVLARKFVFDDELINPAAGILL
jgi:hypothetical protein